jgi:2-polyprenyl-3-methyl-5-hydroxy-6-metoxy-1,4-benzoquinol methylase
VAGGARHRGLSGVATRLGGGRSEQRKLQPQAGESGATVERRVPTRAIGILVDVLRDRRSPVVLDLGRVVGGNVAFLAAEVGCKLVIADLFADLGAGPDGARQSEEQIGAWLTRRVGQTSDSVDAVLCWDVFEHLTVPEARLLASRITAMLRPHGVLVLGFSGEWRGESGYATYEIVDRETLRRQFHSGPLQQARVLTTREAMEMFRGLAVVDTFLLSTRAYEMLFRKPSQPDRKHETMASSAPREV